MFSDYIGQRLHELNVLLHGFKFDLRPDGTYMKNKVGFLPVVKGNKMAFPSTKEECKECPFLTLSPGMESVTFSRAMTEMDKIKQGDLVITAAGQTMVFLAAAKVSLAPIKLGSCTHTWCASL